MRGKVGKAESSYILSCTWSHREWVSGVICLCGDVGVWGDSFMWGCRVVWQFVYMGMRDFQLFCLCGDVGVWCDSFSLSRLYTPSK